VFEILFHFGHKLVSFNFCLDSIWILGSSIVHWAHIYARNLNQDHLGQESSTIFWYGIRGMVWEQLYPIIEFLLARNTPPDILIIHCGGNDIGRTNNTLRGLQIFFNPLWLILQICYPKLVSFGLIFCREIIG
jgi:hypothetical protein